MEAAASFSCSRCIRSASLCSRSCSRILCCEADPEGDGAGWELGAGAGGGMGGVGFGTLEKAEKIFDMTGCAAYSLYLAVYSSTLSLYRCVAALLNALLLSAKLVEGAAAELPLLPLGRLWVMLLDPFSVASAAGALLLLVSFAVARSNQPIPFWLALLAWELLVSFFKVFSFHLFTAQLPPALPWAIDCLKKYLPLGVNGNLTAATADL